LASGDIDGTQEHRQSTYFFSIFFQLLCQNKRYGNDIFLFI